MLLSRRTLFTSGLLAPAIVRAASIMSVPMFTSREARRATRIRFSLITVELNIRWFEDAIKKALIEELMKNGPIPHTNDAWPIFEENVAALEHWRNDNIAHVSA